MEQEQCDSKFQVKVIVRIRPINNHDNTNINVFSGTDEKYDLEVSRENNSNESSTDCFSFENVFDQHSKQADIFNATTDILKAFINGCNGTIFSYGQTGAGKTYTISGGDQYNTRGLLPRMLEYIFQKKTSFSDHQNGFNMEVSYLELYQERLFDLLMEKKWPE